MSAAEKLNPALQIRLKVLKGPHSGVTFVVQKKSFTIGRGPENDVILINDSQISRQHARIELIQQDLEISNLSQKNSILVGGEAVQKWKLTNDSTFTLGDSEILIQYSLGQSIVPVRPQPQAVPSPMNSSAKTAAPQFVAPQTKATQSAVAKQSQQMPAQRPGSANHVPQNINRQMGFPNQPNKGVGPQMSQQQYASRNVKPLTIENILSDPQKRFRLIVGVLALGLVYFLTLPEPKPAIGPVKPILKYEDEFAIKQSSAMERELEKRRKILVDQKNSPLALRVAENFQKGMRDYQNGAYALAQENFQVVLNLDPNHALARRHLYLSKVRFDEVVKYKIMLGESYYQKHNFKYCESLFRQVKDMLEGKSNDQSYQLAVSMLEKCRLAAEGIR